jgi:hypothetical protein
VTDLTEIPEAVYYDAQGYMFNITPYDGEYNTAYWLKRVEFDYDALQFQFDGDHLVVAFGENDNLNEALISLNAMFYQHELVDHRTVVFRNVKPLLSKVQTVGSGYDGYEVRIQAYAWEGLEKNPSVSPVSRDGEWFIMERPIEENCFMIYHGIMYEYELNYDDKRKFKLLNVNPSALSLFKLDELAIYKMTHKEPNKEVRKFITRGIGNKYRDSVDFTLPIRNSLITFNGVDSEYEVTDNASIFYPDSLFSVRHVSNLSFVAQVNFTLGR